MGDKRNSTKKKRSIFNFAPTKRPKEIAAYLSNLLTQNSMCDGLDHHPQDQSHKRAVRNALNSQDSLRLRKLLHDGANVNLVIDDVFWDTPLTLAVRQAYLEIVELLVTSPGCDVNYRDRNKHTPLDEAIRSWLLGGTITKQSRGRRFRILRCLLSHGAKELSPYFLHNVVYSGQNTRSGLLAFEKLVKIVCQKGHVKVKTALLGALISHAKMTPHLQALLTCGADPIGACQQHVLPRAHGLPEDNAIVFIKATNDTRTLEKLAQCIVIPRDSGHDHRRFPGLQQLLRPRTNSINTPRYREALRLLVLSGQPLSLHTMTYMYKNHATLYKWTVHKQTQPWTLRDLAAVSVRRQLRPNIYHAVSRLTELPEAVKPWLLLETNS